MMVLVVMSLLLMLSRKRVFVAYIAEKNVLVVTLWRLFVRLGWRSDCLDVCLGFEAEVVLVLIDSSEQENMVLCFVGSDKWVVVGLIVR